MLVALPAANSLARLALFGLLPVDYLGPPCIRLFHVLLVSRCIEPFFDYQITFLQVLDITPKLLYLSKLPC